MADPSTHGVSYPQYQDVPTEAQMERRWVMERARCAVVWRHWQKVMHRSTERNAEMIEEYKRRAGAA